jgi:hypothetical protein
MMWGVRRENQLSPSSSTGELIDLSQAAQKAETSTPASLDLLRRRCFQPAMIHRDATMVKKLAKVNDLLNLEQARVAKHEVESNRHVANNKEFIRLLERTSNLAINDVQMESMLNEFTKHVG